jgi:hypothetical protein
MSLLAFGINIFNQVAHILRNIKGFMKWASDFELFSVYFVQVQGTVRHHFIFPPMKEQELIEFQLTQFMIPSHHKVQ